MKPHCAPCYNFLRDGTETKVTVWIVPTVVKKETDDKMIIVWHCNWGYACEAAGCRYAKARREEKKEEDNGNTGNGGLGISR